MKFGFRFKIILSALSILGLINYTQAWSGPVKVTRENNQIFLDSTNMMMLEDPHGELTPEMVAAMDIDAFQKLPKEKFENSNPDSYYWLRLEVAKNEELDDIVLLEAFNFKIGIFECYIKSDDGSFKLIQSGSKRDFNTRYFNHKNFEFVIPESGRQQQTVYLKFQTDHTIMLNMVLRTLKKFTNYALSEYFLLGIFYGMIMLISIYNFFLFITVREKAYLYYIAYVISVGFYAMSQDGTGFQYIWPQIPEFNSLAIPTTIYSVVICLLLYTRAFLPVKEKTPILDKVISGYIILRTVYFILAITVLPELRTILILDIIPFGMAYISALTAYVKGFKPARFFIIGFSILLLTFIINSLMYARVISPSIFTVYSLNIGVVLEIFMLSSALAERVRVIRAEKMSQELQNEKLEELVEKRTLELRTANEKLSAQAEEIASMNKLLYEDNTRLKEDVQQISQNRVMQSDLNLEEFSRIYPDDNACFKYLSELKWENGYQCLRCNNETWSNGKSKYSRRCSKCGYDESVSVNTIFHFLKFPIHKAFYMLFLTAQNPDITIEELAEKLQLTTKTCWNFKKKILEMMEKMAGTGKGKKARKTNKWPSLILQTSKK